MALRALFRGCRPVFNSSTSPAATPNFPPPPDLSFLSCLRPPKRIPHPSLGLKPFPGVKKGFLTSTERTALSFAAISNNEELALEHAEVLTEEEYHRYRDQRIVGAFSMQPSEVADVKYEPVWYNTVGVEALTISQHNSSIRTILPSTSQAPDRPASTTPADAWSGKQHWGVSIDGAPLIAQRSREKYRLILPSEEWAVAVAVEFEDGLTSSGRGWDVHTMGQAPMYDLASSAQQMGRMTIVEFIDKLSAGLEFDGVLFRDEKVDDRYGMQLDVCQEWFDRVVGVRTPREVTCADHGKMLPPDVPDDVILRAKEYLRGSIPNKFALVCLHVMARYFHSTIIALAAGMGAIDGPTAMDLGNADELINVTDSGFVRGYHDVRFNDMYVKAREQRVCACVCVCACVHLCVHEG
eukprot:TRINITY_DN20717_c0_g1_i2.p1 TRINITY_DN20717_c0_g1~~TRINITY_DN20717_c0_g1_i2.p1  ORF type:complete len:435 (+),score=65.30 TRINITY_DN20717_c0_g1_i2:78-1307(+)